MHCCRGCLLKKKSSQHEGHTQAPELCRKAVQRNVCYVLILNDQVYPWDSVSEIQYITEMTW